MKKSKLQRKFINQMRAMADVPWPARRFKYPPTMGGQLTGSRCPNLVDVRHRRRRGWRGLIDLLLFRRPVAQPVICGGPLVLHPHSANRGAHVECLYCGPLRRRRRRHARRR